MAADWKGRKMGIEEGMGAMDLGGKEEGGEPMDIMGTISPSPPKLVDLLRKFLLIQQRRAQAYAKLQRGFNEYMIDGAELAYQQLCGEVTLEFNDCSKQVIEMESMLLLECCRGDLADLLKDVQTHEKQKLHMTTKIQLLKSTRPSESRGCDRDDEQSKKNQQQQHTCTQRKVGEANDVEELEIAATHESALKEAIKGVQHAVTRINDHLEAVRYEIEDLESS